jgi:DNA (cytosine-5)-methyltransferase 1
MTGPRTVISGRAGSRRKPKAFDIFCGCGGTTQGLRDAGFCVVGGIECDELAVQTFRANHKRVKVWDEDIRDLDPVDVLKCLGIKRGELDLMAGCPPCQAFSALRRLNGRRRVRDKDSKDLVFEYLRFVDGLFPKVVLVENVPRLLDDYRFTKVRRQLRKLGYEGQPSIFNAADFGVPQRRRRMVFIASRIGCIEYAAPISRDQRATVHDAIAELPRPGATGDELHDFPETRSERVAKLIAMIPKDGGSRLQIGMELQLRCHRKCDGFKDVYGRMAWNALAPTITGGCVNPSKGRFLHPTQNRTITLREAALLQSFPKDYQFALSRGKFAAAQLIGNAFPPLFVEAHAKQIRRRLEKESGEAMARIG